MSTPLTADRLLSALRREGVRVVEHRSWRTHNRNHKGSWGPINGVMIHHTVTSGTDASVRICYDGYSGLPGPLCHGVIAKDGTVHLVGNGRANHAGLGDGDVLDAVIREDSSLPDADHNTVDGNARFYGFECINLGDGDDPWPDEQLEAIERAAAAICRTYGWHAASVVGHKEWQLGKVDPRGFAMEDMRDRIARRLKGAPGAEGPLDGSGETGDGEDADGVTYTVRKGDTLSAIGRRHDVDWHDIATANGLAAPFTIRPGQVLTVPGADGASGGRPRHQPFPGAAWFHREPRSAVVTAMGRRLVDEGCAAYAVGPGPQWTDADRRSYAAWQHKLGFRGADADGWPGPTSWKALRVPYAG